MLSMRVPIVSFAWSTAVCCSSAIRSSRIAMLTMSPSTPGHAEVGEALVEPLGVEALAVLLVAEGEANSLPPTR